MAGKSTRITVDLGSEDLVKSLKIAAVEKQRTVRDIVVEALEAWLEHSKRDATEVDEVKPRPKRSAASDEKDYVSMMENLNRYRGVGGA